MAYKFDNANSNKITTGSTLTAGSSRSVAVRFKVNTFSATASVLYTYGDSDVGPILFFNGAASGKQAQFSYTDSTLGSEVVVWTSAFNTGEVHTLVGTINTATFDLSLYADTDAAVKATTNAGGFAGYAVGAVPLQRIGNYLDSALGFLGVIYEVAVWDGAVLAGSQAATFGAGYDAQFLTPKPTYHWRLVGTAQEARTGATSTVSGATVVAHDAPIRYPAPPRAERLTAGAAPPATTLTQIEGPHPAWRGAWRGLARGMA